MKKGFLLLCVIAVSSFAFSNSIGLQANRILPIGTETEFLTDGDVSFITIHIHIEEFGRMSKNCTGFGICGYMDIDISIGILALAHDDGNGNIVFVFDAATYSRYSGTQFKNNTFILEEDYVINKKVSNALGSTSLITLRKGNYAVVGTADGYEVKLRK